MARKGDSIPDRPHRWTAVLEVPTKRGKVPIELMEKLADANRPVEKQTPTTPQREWQGPQNQSTVSSRARAYLDKMPGAVAGESGHNRTYTAANVLIRGFGIPVVDALPILKEWNEKCQPPWTEKELLHKLEDAGREGGPRGYLLGTSSPGKVLAGSGFQPDFLDSTAFDNLAIEHEWLIKKALVAKQPAVVGGPKKVLKTSLMIDLAVSLGSGQRFLNHFDVPKRLRVLVLSGESGKAAIQNTARRICKAKGISLSQCNIFWGFSLPWLSSDLDLSMLGTGIIENGIEVVIIDPLYLCLLAGNAGLQASNVYQMGPLLLAAARTCLDAGATPILVHHTTKMSQPGRGDNHEPLELDNLAFAGVAEFARQWIIVSRRERFDPDAGDHKLWLNVGGSAGHCGLYGVDIREGILNDRFSGREWLVAVQSATNARAAVAKAKREQKEADKRARDVDDREKVLRVLALFPNGETTKVIGEEAGIGSRVVGVLLELMKNLEVVCTTVHKPCGRNPAMSFKGWRLWRPGEKPLMTTDQSDRLRRGEPVEAVLDTVACGGPEVDSQAGLDGG
jgi:replicative DNA helicase